MAKIVAAAPKFRASSTKLFLVSFKEDVFKLQPFLFNFIQIRGIKSIIRAQVGVSAARQR